MKKVIVLIVMLASAGGWLQAQDTVWQRPAPLNNYFNNYSAAHPHTARGGDQEAGGEVMGNG